MGHPLEHRLSRCDLRAWLPTDRQSLRDQADDARVARWMKPVFPNPYLDGDAEAWLAFAGPGGPGAACHAAIVVEGLAVGGIGFVAGEGAFAGQADLGYWLGRSFWGRGLMTEVVTAVASRLLAKGGFRCLQAMVAGDNLASVRVLERAGFQFEGRSRSGFVRDGQVQDRLQYGRLDTDRSLSREGGARLSVRGQGVDEPWLRTEPALQPILRELRELEPLFHAAAAMATPRHFEDLVAPDFWEIGASGRCYSRDFALCALRDRASVPDDARWQVSDEQVHALANGLVLLSYTLRQPGRVTRRATVWRRGAGGWQAVFHQGTPVPG